MSDKPVQRRGLGRGLGSLIPTAPATSRDGGSVATAEPPVAGPDWIGRLGQPGRADSSQEEPHAPTTAGSDSGSEAGQGSQESGSDLGLRPIDGASFAELPVDAVRPNPRQPRRVFDDDAMAELVHSVREVGLLQPVVVRPVDGGYELVMGERRWRATQQAGMETIPAIIRATEDDALLRDALLENLHRAELNPLEEAAAYQQLLDDFGCTHDELAARIGRSRPQISNTLRLLRLSPPVQRRVAAGVLSAGHARALLGITGEAAQERLAARVVAEGISVRALEEIVAVGEADDERPERRRRAKPVAPAALELAERLSDLYETRVKVDLGRAKGRITIEFASLSDLERIVAAMDPTFTTRNGGGEAADVDTATKQ